MGKTTYIKRLNEKVPNSVTKKGFKKGNQSGTKSLLLKDPSELSAKEQYKLLMCRGFITIDCGEWGKNN
jgi:hypothetical protein